MSVRATKSGFAAEAQAKINEKYDEEHAGQVMEWVRETTNGLIDTDLNTSGSMDNVFSMLSDGYVLNVLMKALGDSSIKPKREKMAFKKMECISQFLAAAERYGLQKTELFQTVDLYERQNLGQVIQTLFALGRKVKTKGGKGIGPKEAERQSREWTEEQLKAGQGIIGLQMGSNKGATQSGQNFGKPRHIVD